MPIRPAAMFSKASVHLSTRALLLAVLATSALPARAANRYWVDTNGGLFGSVNSWSAASGGASGASVPGAGDVAIYDQAGTYFVDFGPTATNAFLTQRAGNITYNLGGYEYIVTGTTRLENNAVMNLVGGTLRGDTVGDSLLLGTTPYLTATVNVGASASLGTETLPMDFSFGYTLEARGTMRIEDGGKAYARNTFLGNFDLSTGTLSVDEPGSLLNNQQNLFVGYFGTGSLTVTNGARVTSGATTQIGYLTASDGYATVSGLGSLLETTTSLTVGRQGHGELTVQAGGRVEANELALAQLTGSSSVARVTGSGSRVDLGSNAYVGDNGGAVLEITSGGTVRNKLSYLGDSAIAHGVVHVSGAGSTWEMTGTAFVGNYGQGELRISDGGAVQSGALQIGNQVGSSGEVQVTGPGSSLNPFSIMVGQAGSGVMRVEDGASVSTQSLFVNGTPGTSTGSLTIDGGSVWVTGAFVNSGSFNFNDGTLTVNEAFQPRPTAGIFTVDGDEPTAQPTLELLGPGAINNINSLYLGDTYRGRLTLGNGRALTIAAFNELVLGQNTGSDGTLDVHSGASVQTPTLEIGGSAGSAAGTGTVNISSNGSVTADMLLLHPGGTINLDGGELVATFDQMDGQINWTSGLLDIETTAGGGVLTLDSATAQQILGSGKTLNAGQTLDGSSITVDTPLTIDGGELIAAVTNNSIIEVKSGQLGGGAFNSIGNQGQILLSGTGAVVEALQVLNSATIRGSGTVGGGTDFTNFAAGDIELTAGDRMTFSSDMTNNGRVSVLGGELQADGLVTNSASTGLISARDAILRFNGDLDNAGGLAIANGTTDVFGDITQQVGGRITVSGGGIANFYDEVTIDPGAADVQATAIGPVVSQVVFFGSYNGGVTGGGNAFIEGDHRPGNSPGLVSFGGSVAYGFFSTLEIELAGTTPGTEYDQVSVADQLALSGTLDILLINGFTPSAGDSFDILDFTSLTGTFNSVNLPTLGPSLQWDTSDLYTTGELSVIAFLPADLDGDGDVDGVDLSMFFANFTGPGGGPPANPQADLDGDGDVDGVDLSQAFSAFTGPLSPANVPEPASLILLTLAGLFATRRRRGTLLQAEQPVREGNTPGSNQ